MPRMHRLTVILPLLAASCSQAPQQTAETWAAGRDGLCLAGEGDRLAAGLIVYGPGNANCSVSGTGARDGDRLRITPQGDPACTIEIDLSGGRAVIGSRSPACAYYCGPGADYSGRTLGVSDRPVGSVTDLAGDPLCRQPS